MLIFSILYESIYLLFLNEISHSRMIPLFLIEGKQWKWEYRFNLVGLLEHSYFKKIVGNYTEVTSFKYAPADVKAISFKYYKILGSELYDASLRVKSELLKSKKNTYNSGDFLKAYSLNEMPSGFLRKDLLGNFKDIFFRFRVSETTRRLLTTNKVLFLPDLPVIKAHVTGCDVIHS